MKKVLVLLGTILAAVALAACGDDEGTTTTESGNGGAAAESGAEGGTMEAGKEGASGKAGGGSTVEFEAPENGGLEYAEDEKTAKAGKVTIEFDNAQPIAHDVAIEDSAGEQVGKTDVITDETTSTTLDLEPGEYKYYCTIPGHREAGMEGTLIVK